MIPHLKRSQLHRLCMLDTVSEWAGCQFLYESKFFDWLWLPAGRSTCLALMIYLSGSVYSTEQDITISPPKLEVDFKYRKWYFINEALWGFGYMEWIHAVGVQYTHPLKYDKMKLWAHCCSGGKYPFNRLALCCMFTCLFIRDWSLVHSLCPGLNISMHS